jgi:hypothetical protein
VKFLILGRKVAHRDGFCTIPIIIDVYRLEIVSRLKPIEEPVPHTTASAYPEFALCSWGLPHFLHIRDAFSAKGWC